MAILDKHLHHTVGLEKLYHMVIPGKHLVRTVIPVRPSSQLILAGKFQAHMMILDKLQKQ